MRAEGLGRQVVRGYSKYKGKCDRGQEVKNMETDGEQWCMKTGRSAGKEKRVEGVRLERQAGQKGARTGR